MGPGETIYVASGAYGDIEVWQEAVTVVSEGGARPPSVDDAVGADFIGFVVNTAWLAGLHSCVTRGLAEQCDLYNCTVGGACFACHRVNCLAATSVGADYRLPADSSAVDAGDNLYVTTAVDLYGQPRISGARVDLGACERDLKNAGWLDPGVKAGDGGKTEAAKVRAALKAQGFSASVCEALASLKDFSALGAWAYEKGIGKNALASSSTPLLSAALGGETLLEWTSADLLIGGLEVSASGLLRGTLPLSGYDREKVNASLLKAAVGLVGAADPSGPFSPDGLDFAVTPGASAVEFAVRPPADAPAWFLRALVR